MCGSVSDRAQLSLTELTVKLDNDNEELFELAVRGMFLKQTLLIYYFPLHQNKSNNTNYSLRDPTTCGRAAGNALYVVSYCSSSKSKLI